MIRRSIAAAALATLLALAAPVDAPAGATPPRDWQSTLGRDHPLAGRVLDTGRGEMLALEDLPARLAGTPLLLLGEIHDNPDHHRLRGWLLTRLHLDSTGSTARPRPAVVLEHVRLDQQAALDSVGELNAAGRPEATSEALFRSLDWGRSGWPPEALFAPLFDVLLAGRFPLLPGEPQRGRVREVARSGLGALAASERERLGLDRPWPDAFEASLLAELEASHCGLLPRSAFGGLSVAQRYRDAELAAQMVAGAERHGAAVLLAGNGHVRRDRGVPWHLGHMAPGRRTASVILVEVIDGRTEPTAYVERDAAGSATAEVLVFTPRVDRPDPCIEMREMFKKRRESGG